MPVVGGRMPAIRRPSVDLPQPDSPTSPRVSPLRIVKETSETARTDLVSTSAPNRAAIFSPKLRLGLNMRLTLSMVRNAVMPKPLHLVPRDGNTANPGCLAW